jgi:hypothetical protein
MMSDEQNSGNTFVIPQRRAGKHFREMTSQRKIEKIRLETARGAQLANLPIQINVNKVVPRFFRLPMQAGVTATSVLARLFHVKITFGLKDNES